MKFKIISYLLILASLSVSCSRSNYELDSALKGAASVPSSQAVVSGDYAQILLNFSDDVAYCTISGAPLKLPIKVWKDGSRIITIDNLQPSTRYQFDVNYYSSGTTLLYADKVQFKTLDYDSSELEVMITDLRHALLRFKCKTNSDIDYYTVSVIETGRPGKILSGSKREQRNTTFEVKNLKPGTSYEISYQTFYKKGGSSPVRKVKLETLKMLYASYFYFNSEYYPITHLTTQVKRDYDAKPIGKLSKYLILHGPNHDNAVTQLTLSLTVPEYEGISNFWPQGAYKITGDSSLYNYIFTLLLKAKFYNGVDGDYIIKYSNDLIICDFDLDVYGTSGSREKLTGHFSGKFQK